ncbi:EF-hand domain-containing protein [Corallococcus macrosporus]|uniref:EF hand domain-containing protein n=1 Tax=Myxococcus fulvus (strain ATCC BAA-855 / HW-1) TaxID=483219 RepID=F8C956_MYXFH|nr:EF-hand domain-containing protein [Corallococcus macrosporus]AEI65757.1 EF hand domain-containing protein [Corallococcus macrosporus]
MATKSRKTAVAKKSSRRSATAKKATPKKAASKKAGGAKKRAAKKTTAKKTTAKKSAAKKTTLKKPSAKKAATKQRAAKKATAKKTTARKTATRRTSAPRRERPATGDLLAEQVETTSAGLQPLAPAHAPVDEFTSTGNEVLDIFQRYDRDRTGTIDRAEFARLLEALGQNISDEELEIAVDIVDTDRTGKISWNEFKAWWNSR